ncbi:MAG: metallophosphoesterase [Candidatus Nanoarchaeia archaeon]|jgi:Icc-related predicted phosphoesterase
MKTFKRFNDMKLLLIGDFHGKIPKLKKEHKDFDAILCTGDLPYSKELTHLAFEYSNELHEGKELHELISKKNYVHLYKKAFESQTILLEWLNKWNKPVFFVYGNHDYDYLTIKSIKYFPHIVSLNKIIEKYSNIHLLTNKIVKFKGINIVGFSDSFSRHFKTDKFKKMWNSRLTKLFKKTNKKEFNIFLTHDPPSGVLDLVKNKKSFAYGKHYGDNIMVKYVKKYAPEIMVCGHMHENQGKKMLGNTLVINAGYAYEGNYSVLALKNNKFNVKIIKK